MCRGHLWQHDTQSGHSLHLLYNHYRHETNMTRVYQFVELRFTNQHLSVKGQNCHGNTFRDFLPDLPNSITWTLTYSVTELKSVYPNSVHVHRSFFHYICFSRSTGNVSKQIIESRLTTVKLKAISVTINWPHLAQQCHIFLC